MRSGSKPDWQENFKTSQIRIENKQTQPTYDVDFGIEPRPHWWKASTLITAPTLLAKFTPRCLDHNLHCKFFWPFLSLINNYPSSAAFKSSNLTYDTSSLCFQSNKTIKRTFSDKRLLVFSSKMSLSCKWKKNDK